MKKAMKVVETVVLLVLIIVVLAIIGFSLYGENMIKKGVETAGTKALKVAVKLDNLNLSLFKGAVGINGLTVANPQGYEHQTLLELQSGNITTKLKSLMSDTVQIESINLDGVSVSIEQKGLSNNLQDILNAIPKTDEPAATSDKPSKKLHIKQLKISNVKVNVKLLPVPGKADTIILELEPIEMSNLGSDDKMTTAKLAKEVVLAIAKNIAKKGAGLLPDDMLNNMNTSINQAAEMGKAAIEEGQKAVEEGKGLLEDAKGIFNKPNE